MLKYFLLCIALSSAGLVAAQCFVKGKVRDAKTLEPLPFANVYINNTTIGAPADENGDYLLKNVPVGVHEIVFSFVGYQSYSTKVRVNVGETILLNIKLKANPNELENVSISSTRDKEWEKRMKRFTRVFLGETKAAAYTKILNPWCVELSETKKSGKKELRGSSTQPIEIENLALGYRIFYDLKNFVSTNEFYQFSGNIFFQEIKSTDSIQTAQWTKNRLDAYHGSTRHLFKSILDNRLTEEGFQMYAFKPGFEKNTVRSTVFAQDVGKVLTYYNPSGFFLPGRHPGEFKISLPAKVEIHYLKEITPFRTYRDVMVPVSDIEVAGGFVEVSQFGVILNPNAVITSGRMSESRLADVLPNNYAPGKGDDFVSLKSFSKEQFDLDRLRENVYLHTDKSYYYPGEVIWLKGYMKYNYPEIADSLSAVLYVDVIGANKKILQTKVFPIDSGRAIGSIFLPGSYTAGNYWLRAYTNWMRNYPEKSFFVTPLPILGLYDNLEWKAEDPLTAAANNQVEIKPDRENYHVRDSVSLTITLKDEYDNPILADLSISVTDAGEILSLQHRNIEDEFSKIDNVLSISTAKEETFQVEHGISVGGQFLNVKGKPEKTKLTIIQGDLEDMTTVNTDENGNFWTSGFQFYDSLEFALRPTLAKKRLFGNIELRFKESPSVPDSLPILDLLFKKQSVKSKQLPQYTDNGQARMLEEVVVKASKIDDLRPFLKYGSPDNTIMGDQLIDANYSNLMYAIQSRVPGLRFVLVDGTYYLLFGGVSSFGAAANMEPLLLIDGLPYNGTNSVTDVISQLSISNILRIDVFRYGSATSFGARGANGVISIYTKNGISTSEQNNGYDKTLFQLETIRGFDKPLMFKSPSYSGFLKMSAEPDYRSTIYWQPSVKTNALSGEALVSFFAADVETKYRVVVEGVTASGEPVYAKYFIQILK